MARKNEQIEPDAIKKALDHATELKNMYSDRDTMFDEMDKMYFMEWEDKPKDPNMKFTMSPGPRNALLGATRLLSSTEPIFSVPHQDNMPDIQGKADKIEKLCRSIWYHSGRFRGVPLEQPAIESMLRYGMMVLAAFDTDDLVSDMSSGSSKAQKRQMERVQASTPYIIEAWDPKSVYPQWGRFGLSAVYREVDITVSDAKQRFGLDAIANIIGNANDAMIVQYADYWDLTYHFAWISSVNARADTTLAGEPIISKPHNLPCIPIVVQTAEGSYLDDTRYQAIPFLYTVNQAKLWERENLILTYGYTNLFSMAGNPTYKLEGAIEGDEVYIDTAVPGGIVRTKAGSKISPLEKDVFNKDLTLGMDLANRLMEQSTIYGPALGEPMGSGTAFSTVALLHQAGRLPLASAQKRGGWGIGSIMETVFELWKDKALTDNKARERKAISKTGTIDFNAKKDIPDNLIIEATLDVDLPQDMVSQATIAAQMRGLMPESWIRENLLNEGQSEEIVKQIWTETASKAMFEAGLQKSIQDMMQPTQTPGQTQGQMPGQMQGQPQMQNLGMRGRAMVPASRPGMQPTSMGEPQGMQEGEVIP